MMAMDSREGLLARIIEEESRRQQEEETAKWLEEQQTRKMERFERERQKTF